MHKLSVEAPPKILVERYLIEIAKNYNVPYEPDSVVMVSERLRVWRVPSVFQGLECPSSTVWASEHGAVALTQTQWYLLAEPQHSPIPLVPTVLWRAAVVSHTVVWFPF